MQGILRAWGRIVAGRRPALSVEITRECPLACPGCYAYNDGHLGDAGTLRRLSDYHGPGLVERFFRLMDAHKPLHVSIVGGEPLVRFRELNEILPRLSAQGIYAQVVTSAVRPIPEEWRGLPTWKSRCPSTGCGLSMTSGERRPPTSGFRNTSPGIRSPCTAP